MTIEASYHSEVRFVRSSYSSKTGTTITLALPDSDELSKVQGMDGKRYMLALVEIGDDEQPVQKPEKTGGPLAVLAGRWCQEPEFWRFLSDFLGWPASSEADAVRYVRMYCQIESRAELDHNPDAARLFHSGIRGPYIKWTETRGVRFSCPEVEEV